MTLIVVHILINTVQHTNQRAVLIEQVVEGLTAPDRGGDMDDTDVSDTAGRSGEVVGLTLDGSPTSCVRLACPVQLGTLGGILPMTVDLDEVLELVGAAVDGLRPYLIEVQALVSGAA
jgi:hypothetical protein